MSYIKENQINLVYVTSETMNRLYPLRFTFIERNILILTAPRLSEGWESGIEMLQGAKKIASKATFVILASNYNMYLDGNEIDWRTKSAEDVLLGIRECAKRIAHDDEGNLLPESTIQRSIWENFEQVWYDNIKSVG